MLTGRQPQLLQAATALSLLPLQLPLLLLALPQLQLPLLHPHQPQHPPSLPR